MISDWNIDEELNRIKSRIEELEVIIQWNSDIDKSIDAEKELEEIYDKLKEI